MLSDWCVYYRKNYYLRSTMEKKIIKCERMNVISYHAAQPKHTTSHSSFFLTCFISNQSNLSYTTSAFRTKHGLRDLLLLFNLVAAATIIGLSDAGFACLSNPCVYGVCIDDLNSTYSCYCIDGYTGVHCQTNWDECWSSPCLNGGTCIDGIASYNCTCPDGFLGLNCEENYNECQSNPCQNGGICQDKDNAFYCSCVQGYEGDFCEVDIAVCNTGDRCHNGAICIEGPGLEYSCRCTDGYEGRLCEAEINECASAPCQNGAICIDKFASYICACSMGFSGMNCEEEIMICADSPCANRALCLMEEESPTCYCVPDFHGERCELQYDECQLGPERCVNGGTCVDGVDEYFCICAPNFSGENCECLVLEEEEQIHMDCNYTIPESNITVVQNSVSTTIETLLSTTDMVSASSPELEYNTTFVQHLQTSTTSSVYRYTDPKLQVTSTVPSNIIYSTPNSIDDETNTDNFHVYSTTSLLTTAGVESKEYNPMLPSIGSIGENSEDISTTTVNNFSDIPAITNNASWDVSTIYSPGMSTSSFTEPKDFEQHTSYNFTTVTSDLSSFFTESPTTNPSASLGFEDYHINQGFVKTTAAEDNQVVTSTPRLSMITTTSGLEETIEPGMITTDIVASTTSTRLPEVVRECDDTICANGGTCSMHTNGVRCHCDFRFSGQYCDTPVNVQNAAFSKDSYLRHIIYQRNRSSENTERSYSTKLEHAAAMTVRFKAKLTSREGLILLATADGDEGNHYVALFLHNGLLQFQFSCGMQTMLLSEIEGTVNNGSELTIKVQLNFNERLSHCNASLHVNETLAMSGEQPTWLGNVSNFLNLGQAGPLASIRQCWLHLGGRSFKTMFTLSHNISRYHGFTGCIYDLEINNLPVPIFHNAEDAYRIYECTSLACLSSPCRNGATCIENNNYVQASQGFEMSITYEKLGPWSCKCAFGYIGKSCERSICDNNPCQFGGTCVTFPESGYLCLCPYGKHGHFCEHDLDILQPSFFGSIKGVSSYVSYPIAFPLEDWFEFSFKIIPTTEAQISLLAFIGQSYSHLDQRDHFAVSFIQGFILVTWDLGSGPRRIFTQKPVQVQQTRPTTIQVGRNGKTAWLSVDGKVNISGNSPGSSTKLNVKPQLYLGGHEQVNFSSLPHDLPLHSGFQGCLFDIRLVAGPLNIPLQHIGGMRGRSVGQCGTKECHRHACQNNGACLQHGSTFTCICQEGWNGILCSQKLNPCDQSINKCAGPDVACFPLISGYECDCPFGKVGPRCEKTLNDLSDVSFTGRRSYLALRWPHPETPDYALFHENEVRYEKIVHHSHFIPYNYSILLKSIRELDKINDVLKVSPMSNDTVTYDGQRGLLSRSENYRQLKIRQISIELQLRPLSEKGLILFVPTIDTTTKEQGFISLSLQGGVVEYRVSSDRSKTNIVRSNHVMATGEWHTIRVVKFGKRLTLWVEGKGTSVIGSTREEYMTITSDFYLGGMPDLSKLPYDAISGFPVPFNGCIRGVILNGTRVALNSTFIVSSRNINDCDGTPCGGDICGRGSLCWLDKNMQPHCKCKEHLKGIDCSIQESCEIVQCHNNGNCMKNGRCSCSVGWTGHYCEIATKKYSSIGFDDHSYILIPFQKIKNKDKRNDDSGLIGTKSWMDIQLTFNISTLEDGLLIWTADTQGRYFGAGIREGFIVVTTNMFEDVENNFYNKDPLVRNGFVTDGDWHNIMLVWKDSHVHLSVDGITIFSGMNLTFIFPNQWPIKQEMISDGIAYLGGFPEENVFNRTNGYFSRSFIGCIQNIFMGGNISEEPDDTAYDGANINECAL